MSSRLKIKNHDVIVGPTGARFRVVSFKRRDDRPDDFKLDSLSWDVRLQRRWTAEVLAALGYKVEGQG